ncbi:DNA-directed RNA polymerase II largest subunit [Invertebrate iridescent virus 30]|uniref:DNA-directed RNA polymerase subunit n=1 Tax=Invertebrate iridescent virus 30 TaxID=345585 RepID=W8W254_9VIRU|nr:DNA-directed RNA polymerase II largest subunit [Invertebrate iridescent virus 30]CCV02236.1 DNA-directed RNA polymerase II largest subunit [Invertebrate iridescent virus 30]
MMFNNECEISNINKISFGVLSPEEILKMSCCNVTAVKVSDKGENIYSKFMGTIENGENCKTCDKDVWECAGHFGHFNLETPVVNPIFINDVTNVLRCICFECYGFILSEDHLKLENMVKKFADILNWVKNIKYCYRCDAEKTQINVVNETIVDEDKIPIDTRKILRVLENMDNQTVKFLGFNPEMSHPKNFIFTIFPVLPPCCRPYVMSDENCCDDDLTYQLTEIIKNNQYLSDEYLTKTELKRKKSVLQSSLLPTSDIQQKHFTNLKFRISTYFNNSKKKAKHAATARPITGLKERIAGKEGQIRHNLLGKRCDQSGRTVVGPDPTLKLNELGIPDKMAEILTIPVYVTPFNINQLTSLVNCGKANFLIKKNDPKRSINLKNIINFRGTLLYFGDIIERNGEKITITDTKFILKPGDTIIRNGKYLREVKYPEKKVVTLEVGDLVKRQLMDGDDVLLNRQPTLHKASMQSFKVKIQPVKTFKMNLAMTKAYNADFDGDEMNLHVPQSYGATAELQELSSSLKCIMSNQNGKPNVAIVQDSLIGLFYLSKDEWTHQTLNKTQFFDLLMVINSFNYNERKKQILEVLPPNSQLFCGRGVLSFVFPPTFDYVNLKINMIIKNGVFIKGTLEKGIVSQLIKIIYKDYGECIVASFIDNIQFVTNKYLIEKGFTINAADCLKKQNKTEMENMSNAAFIKASTLKEITINPFIREQKILGTFSSLTDQSMKKSKDSLSPQNNFKITEESGSKGSIFNICQITSMLGQQTIDGKRVYGLIHPQDNEFKNKGFIERSFVEGLRPREFLHHAMAGRKGVIDTALLTSVSGYGQRQGVKLNEDIKVYPDYTVRDVNGRLYQYIFGEVGYDPAQIIVVDGKQTICDIYRLTERLKKSMKFEGSLRMLTGEELDFLVDFIQPRSCIPTDVENRICKLRKDPIICQLKKIQVYDDLIPILKNELEIRYYQALMSPGECVGIIGAQSMGEFSTQATLNTFHIAGSTTTGTVTNCLTRFQEINNATKNPKNIIGKIYFTRNNSTIEEIRTLGVGIKHIIFQNIVEEWHIQKVEKEWWYSTFKKLYDVCITGIKFRIRFILNKEILYSNKLVCETIKKALEDKHNISCIFSPLLNDKIYFDIFCGIEEHKLDNFVILLYQTYICGIEGVKAISFHKCDNLKVWYIQTEGGTLKDFYTLDDIDVENTSTNNVWDIYNTLGIEAAREFRIKEMVEIMGSGVDLSHIKLRADRLTFTGTIQSLTRYTMRGEKPFSKVGFEEIMENFYRTARDAEVDDLTGVSASIMCGKRAKVGTSMFDIKLDINKILSKKETLPFIEEDNDDNEAFIDYDYSEK